MEKEIRLKTPGGRMLEIGDVNDDGLVMVKMTKDFKSAKPVVQTVYLSKFGLDELSAHVQYLRDKLTPRGTIDLGEYLPPSEVKPFGHPLSD